MPAARPSEIRAVLFDLGGVVLPSPFDAFVAHERERGLSDGFLRGVVAAAGDTGAWARLERGELDLAGFATAFEGECAAAGGTISAAELMAGIAGGAGPRPAMVRAIQTIRQHGLATGAITNNWAVDDGSAQPFGDRFGPLFDVVIESSATGLRKPDPRIYRMACETLKVEPPACVFLDDLGVNLKPAREMGMTTIKVIDPETALNELSDVLGFPLG